MSDKDIVMAIKYSDHHERFYADRLSNFAPGFDVVQLMFGSEIFEKPDSKTPDVVIEKTLLMPMRGFVGMAAALFQTLETMYQNGSIDAESIKFLIDNNIPLRTKKDAR